jgi:hypothetical protein
LAEEPEPRSSEAEVSTPEFGGRYGGLEEKIKDVSLEILVWEPERGTDEMVANERQAIHQTLKAENHQSYLGRELEVPPKFSLQDREVELALDADLTVVLAEPLALGELHEFGKYEDLLGNTFIRYPKLMQSAPDKSGWDKKVKDGYGLLDYYEEEDITSCKVREDVLNWVEIRRSIRYSSISSRRGR